VTLTRLVLILGAVFVFTDYKLENGLLVGSLWHQTTEIGYKLNNTVSQIVRQISP